jgi:hypothetical protein
MVATQSQPNTFFWVQFNEVMDWFQCEKQTRKTIQRLYIKKKIKISFATDDE